MASTGNLMLLLGLAISSTTAYIIPSMAGSSANDTHYSTRRSSSSPLVGARQRVARDVDDPADFGWIRKWAAIGDSFTAGIGSGSQLGKVMSADWKCSRYGYSWPAIVNQALGPSVQSFEFKACSGARTGDVVTQATALPTGLDVVMMTAGGNDLCLSAIIGDCIFQAYQGEQACDAVLTKAQSNIDTILKPNIRQILGALDAKIKQDGVLVYVGYAPYFDTTNEDCANPDKQAWNYHLDPTHWTSTPLRLTKARRQRFNTLVDNVNKAIQEVVEEEDDDGTHPYRLVYADWSEWPAEVDGQMCSPSSNGRYPDTNQPNLQFIKPDTYSGPPPPRDTLRRDLDGSNGTEYEAAMRQAAEAHHAQMLYESTLFNSPNPQAVARRELEARAGTVPAACPGDGTVKEVLGMGLPDSFLSNFHPNNAGHETMAAAALDNLVRARAKVLGKDSCPMPMVDSLQCEGKPAKGAHNKPYVSTPVLVETHKEFCLTFRIPPNTLNWEVSVPFKEGTPEEHTYTIRLYNSASTVDRATCREAFERIIHRCDGGPDNPLNFKFGGVYRTDDYEFRLEPYYRWHRPFVTRTDGICNSHYKFTKSRYHISGQAWATSDWGESKNGFLDQIKKCTGKLKNVHWKYCQAGECDGDMDWEMSFESHVFVRKRCFDNLKVQGASGGYTHKYKHDYPVWGCSGSD
ncbi:SGNH hydrolase-type esterase domain-containing protein [Podospora conica]|nr:SGNH hydrolase-type esterase domain-containing protein [Schizothecium conicum]